MAERAKLAGRRFGRLVAVEYVGQSKWFCSCDCGGSTVAIASNLVKGNSTSCGCKNAEARFKHGMASTPVHHVWRSMRARCNNPKDAAYSNYGGRGIIVCERWDDFSNFIADMGQRPPRYQIDRIDNDGPYSPENCRWVKAQVNLSNKRTNHMLTYQGTTMTLTAWARKFGLDPVTLYHRLKHGWSLEDALMKPKHSRNKRKRKD